MRDFSHNVYLHYLNLQVKRAISQKCAGRLESRFIPSSITLQAGDASTLLYESYGKLIRASIQS